MAAQRLKDIGKGARRYLRRGALVIPFIVGPFVVRLAIGPVSDALAGAMIAVAPEEPGAPSPSDPSVRDDDGDDEARPAARDGHRDDIRGKGRRRGEGRRGAPVDAHPERDAADAGKAPSAPSSPSIGAPKGTIVVPASIVTKAIEAKDVGARDARGADGKPLGARIHGVTRYHTGLLDGDIIIAVGGVRTETTAAMVDAATKSLGAGATKLNGQILRGENVWNVLLELPPRQ